MEKENHSCQVKRIGVVVRVEREALWIQVGAQVIPIAAHKADPALRTGDRVEWTGRTWRVCDEPV